MPPRTTPSGRRRAAPSPAGLIAAAVGARRSPSGRAPGTRTASAARSCGAPGGAPRGPDGRSPVGRPHEIEPGQPRALLVLGAVTDEQAEVRRVVLLVPLGEV